MKYITLDNPRLFCGSPSFRIRVLGTGFSSYTQPPFQNLTITKSDSCPLKQKVTQKIFKNFYSRVFLNSHVVVVVVVLFCFFENSVATRVILPSFVVPA